MEDKVYSTINFNYGILPKNVMKEPNLNIQAKAIYAYLIAYAGNKGAAFPSAELMRHELGIGKDTFYKYMKELKELGYVSIDKEKDKGKFKHNIYYLQSTPCPKSSDTVLPDTESSDTEISDTNNNSFNNNNLNNNKRKSYCPNSNEFRLASYLYGWIKKNNPKAKEPNLQTWSKQFDKILRIDGRKVDEVKNVIEWSQKDDFWFKNILSPDKLRKQYDRLLLQMEDDKKNGTNNQQHKQNELDPNREGIGFKL